MTARRLDRAVLAVRGPDAPRWLNDLITQDLSRLPAEGLAYGGLLTAQGKLIADFFIARAGDDGFLLDAAPARAGPLAQRLRLYRLRAAVEIADVSGSYAVVAGGAGPPDPRLAGLGARALVPVADAPAPGAEDVALRLALGVPDCAADFAPEEPFALEALFEELNGVDFHKGCFVGQENVSRMKRRATTRRKICPVTHSGPAPAFGTRVTAGAADLGDIRSGLEGRALAFLRLDRALEAISAGQTLTADGRPLALAPPDWLILPKAAHGASAED